MASGLKSGPLWAADSKAKDLGYPDNSDEHWHYRLSPEFTAPTGKYEWLNNQLFIANLVDVPVSMHLAKGPKENDRLIQVYRVL